MNRYNGYTTVEQSKKLAEILPVESADMYYTATTYGEQHEIIGTSWELHLGLDAATKDHLFSFRNGYTFPCWSLFALLESIPSGIVLLHDINGLGYKCIKDIDTNWHKNPVDACVEMIVKLHESNKLVLWL